MVIEESCYWCGKWFVKEGKKHARKYCCEECRRLAEKQQKNKANKIYNDARKHRKTEQEDKPGLPMNDMLELMDKLSKERGRVVQYGEVQQEILTGKLKVKGGGVKC